MVAKNYPIKTKLSEPDHEILTEIHLELEALKFKLSGMSVLDYEENVLEFDTLVSDLVDFINTYFKTGLDYDISILHSFAKSTNLFTRHFLTPTNFLNSGILQSLRVIELRFELLYYSVLFDFESGFGSLGVIEKKAHSALKID